MTGSTHEKAGSTLVHLAAKAWRKYCCRDQWYLLLEQPLSQQLIPDPARSTAIYPPRGCYWADPFVWSTPDAHFVFVEELVYATDKGHICVLELSRQGLLKSVRKVLEQPYHLSYPFLFQWNDQLYMLPEAAQSKTVALYRCIEFPNRWEADQLLLADADAADSTLIEHAGRWWMFNSQYAPGHGAREHLHLYEAPTPLGPFTPHAGNPVKSGLRGTRPAGAMFYHDGALYRPAQDSTREYGGAVLLYRVDELSHTGFRETEVGCIAPDTLPRTRGLHTLNSGDGVRVMDALRWVRRW